MNLPDDLPRRSKPLVLFDGVCNWCVFWVNFIIRRDPEKQFLFASLQSPTGLQISRAVGLPDDALTTMIFVEDGRYYLKSSAALHILRRMKGFWPLLFAFILVPQFFRDACYDVVGKNRYRWFGRKESCLIPTPDIRERFVDSISAERVTAASRRVPRSPSS